MPPFDSGSVVRDAADFRILGREQQIRDRDDTAGSRPSQKRKVRASADTPSPRRERNSTRLQVVADRASDDVAMHKQALEDHAAGGIARGKGRSPV